MEKGFFIHLISYDETEELEASGIYKKIRTQVRELNRNFEVILETHNQKIAFKNKKYWKIWIRLPFTPSVYKWRYEKKYSEVDFIYFRRSLIDSSLIKFLSRIKKNNPNIKILFEIATYPYDDELSVLKKLPFYIKEKVNRRKLKKIVDRIITFSEDDEIFGIPTIKTINGLDFKKVPVRNPEPESNEINLIAVASIEYWHGYDRFLKGLGEYYKNEGRRNIKFHIVGDGTPINDYKKIVEELNIKEHVIFHGKKYGKELDEIYDKCSLAIACLGGHRKKLYLSSSLKSREYAAKGLPIISSISIDFIPDDYKYLLFFDSDESPINVDRVVEFYEKIYKDNDSFKEVNKEIRDFAEIKCSISLAMKPVIDFILNS